MRIRRSSESKIESSSRGQGEARRDGSDVELLAAVALGDHDALGQLYRRHAAYLFGVALHFMRDRQDAEDLLHDVFVEAWQHASAFEASRGSPRAWLALRLRSRAIDRLRRGRRAAELDSHRVPVPATSDRPDLQADRLRARQALVDLSNGQRQVIELSYFAGMSASEIALQQDLPLGTVKSRLAAGLIRLRGRLTRGLPS